VINLYLYIFIDIKALIIEIIIYAFTSIKIYMNESLNHKVSDDDYLLLDKNTLIKEDNW